MTKRLTQQEAVAKAKNFNAILLGTYINNHTCTDFKCVRCGTIYQRTLAIVCDRNKNYCQECGLKQKSVSHTLSQIEAENLAVKAGCKLIGKYITTHIKAEFECPLCNDSFFRRPYCVFYGKQIRCIKCAKKSTAKLLLLSQEEAEYKSKQCGILMMGQYHGDKTKTQYDKIYQYKKSKITIDITIPEYKIAIEYDEWYWHGHKQKKDKLRLAKIRRLGWKTLQIKASDNLPTALQIEHAINDLIFGAKQRTITLDGWGHGPTFIRKNNEKSFIAE